MSTLSAVQAIKNVGSVVICDYATGVPYPLVQSVDSVEIKPKVDKATLANARGVLDEDIGLVTYEVSMTAYEYGEGLFKNLFGGRTTDYSAIAAINDIANIGGTSAYSVTTGAVPGLNTGDSANIKVGYYRAVVKTATTMTLYRMTDVSANDGLSKPIDDTMIAVDDIAITANVATNITGYGIKLTGGSGTIAMTIGDFMEFRVSPAVAGWKHEVGIANPTYKLVSAFIYPRKKNSNYRCLYIRKFLLTPVDTLVNKDYSKYTLSASLLLDSTVDKTWEFIVN
jgi:hypothetical protein